MKPSEEFQVYSATGWKMASYAPNGSDAAIVDFLRYGTALFEPNREMDLLVSHVRELLRPFYKEWDFQVNVSYSSQYHNSHGGLITTSATVTATIASR